ncbi:aspartyl-phosphate phosphatase Spo0E family protein [Brassicibacter mesophilus]|jgi:hypothetical protein|uniref:aspartyl-phosphate phosphatase Spo0E family protein n=1 Tax=Brassicibacter mesophilus TaxID=745119 RepID=UPI003D1B63B4
MTLNDEIIVLRDKLNASIVNNDDYNVIYNLSIELDTLISLFYKAKKELSVNKKKVS